MASFRARLEQHLQHQIFVLYDEEDPAAIAEGSPFLRVMAFDARKISDSVISFVNNDTVDAFDYQIFGSLKHVEIDNSPFGDSDPENDAPPIADPSWINLLRDSASTDPLDPANFDQTFFRTVPKNDGTKGINYESFSNKWAWVQILCRTTKTGGLTARILHRGTNVGK